MINKKKNPSYILSLFFSLLVFIILFLNIPSGFILGGDWTFPVNLESYNTWKSLSTWNSNGNFGDSSVLSLNSLYYKLIISFIFNIGVPLIYIQKFLIIFFFLIGQIGFVYLMKEYFVLSKKKHLLIINLFSIFFIFSPVMFNYLQMGWIFMVIAYLIYPIFLIFFHRSIKHKKFIDIFISSIILSIAFMQAQAFVWYLISSSIFLFDPKFNKKLLILNFIKISFLSLIFNLHWIIPILFDFNMYEQIVPKTLILTEASTGIEGGMLKFENLFRFYGSVMNQHYEYWYKTSFGIFSYISSLAPFLLILILIKNNKKSFPKIILFYLIIIPLILFFINANREFFFDLFFILIPFRHLSRFIIIFPFLVYFLIIYLLVKDKYSFNFKNLKGTLILFLLILNCLNLSPWIQHLSFKVEKNNILSGKEFKLREYSLDEDYKIFFTKLRKDKKKFTRSFYFPYGAIINDSKSYLFNGGYYSHVDIISATSPVPGAISSGQGRFSNSKLFIKSYFVNYDHKHFTEDLLKKLFTVDLFIYRKNVTSNSKLTLEEFKKIFEKNKKFKKYFESENLLVYEKIKKNKLIQSIHLSEKDIKKLTELNNFYEINKFEYSEFNPISENFERFGDSIILINKNKFSASSLVFHESFSQNWCLLKIKGEYNKIDILLKLNLLKFFFKDGCYKNSKQIFNHSIIWQNYDNKINHVLIYKPQIGFYISLILYIFLIICFFIIFYQKKRKNA
jgi:hypothetical protein